MVYMDSPGSVCSMARKRPLGVTDIEPCKSAKVHAVVTSLSPIKSSRTGTTKYFDGKISDGKSSRQIVGFDSMIHGKLQEFFEKQDVVAVDNCEIKESQHSSALDVVIKNKSELLRSPSKISEVFSGGGDVCLGQLSQIVNFERISVQ